MYIVFLAAFITLFLQVDLCVDEGAINTMMKHSASKMVADSHSKTGAHNRCVYIIQYIYLELPIPPTMMQSLRPRGFPKTRNCSAI